MSNQIDAFKAAILGTILSSELGQCADDVQKKRAALLPKFETEQEALQYARRVALLRPGDPIKVLNRNDDGFMPAVFVCADDRDIVFMAYDPEDKRLASGRISWHAVVID